MFTCGSAFFKALAAVGSAALKFNVTTNSQYIGLVCF